ncbi:MAG: RNA 2',3'-cyclic phosphodiesterase, partial [Myxococcota bacterium]|nr:RNA 2',3'-cyclic phosphodiesterase [Myxococcota bacterium]
MKTYRAFLAVPLGDEVVRAATELSVQIRGRIREAGVRAKWVPPQNLHVTLRFLGNIAAEQGRAVGEALGPVLRGHASFLARFGAVGAFPSAPRPAVLWIGIGEGAEAMTNLGVDVGRAVTALGFPEEDRPFHAHVTIASARRIGDSSPARRRPARTSTSTQPGCAARAT